MRFMMLVKSAESSGPPPKGFMEAFARLSEEAAKAGTMVTVGGLAPTALGARIRLSKGQITVTDGPFSEAKEVIGGYAIYDVASKTEAIDWTRRFLEAHIGLWEQELEVEIRQMMDGDPSQGC